MTAKMQFLETLKAYNMLALRLLFIKSLFIDAFLGLLPHTSSRCQELLASRDAMLNLANTNKLIYLFFNKTIYHSNVWGQYFFFSFKEIDSVIP